MRAEDLRALTQRAHAMLGHAPLRGSSLVASDPASPGGFERALERFHPSDQARDAVLFHGLKDPHLVPHPFTVNRAHRPEIDFPYVSHTNE